ncbi:MAG: helix-turn-helix domain-containing protein [Sulfurimonas sp.]|uniref:helix-turn-helix domain-containing protein n=1 Tax=Sulfurimonas sp. TaxID=2022749 RepID=UPI0025E68186|nr:helix-turn-helix domain-containing protein [Sulfurimonas sp.]MCK9455208.1 helix-turn-helix domain-containing protein [Sulfurimonas sp.]
MKEYYTKEYYTTEEVAKGIDGLLPISKTTLRNLRLKRRIRFSKVGNVCVYKKEWIQDYIDKNEVQPIAG